VACAFGGATLLERVGAAPRLVGPYIERRATDHSHWIEESGRFTNRVLQELDRGDTVPRLELPTWAGAREIEQVTGGKKPIAVHLPDELRAAIQAARPGDVIDLAPGIYRFTGAALQTPRGGTEAAPITVRAEMFGSVTLEFDLLEGFLVSAPFWQFENLVVRGVCANHSDCEHAFHVVGPAHHTVIQNNRVSDFNAHIKINGSDGRFPDNGRIANNTLTNTVLRRTANPVTPIDLVGASNWSIEANLIADFIKGAGDLTSYGAFTKGAGHGNKFVRNVVICEWRLRGAPGHRVGLSFGGGGSAPSGCRDRKCVVEHEDGLMADNLIASCSDEGIYINRSPRSRLVHNTLLDTAGLYVRYPESTANVTANLVDGAIRTRENALVDESDNVSTGLWALYLGSHPVRNLFADPETLDLRFRSQPKRVSGAEATHDLCGTSRPALSAAGAFEDFATCQRDGVR